LKVEPELSTNEAQFSIVKVQFVVIANSTSSHNIAVEPSFKINF
jgi:hypothetical protein